MCSNSNRPRCLISFVLLLTISLSARVVAQSLESMAGSVPGIVQSQLTIVQPNGGEFLVGGANAIIRWSGVTPVTPVKLEYSTDEGVIWNLIADRATGLQYTWVVPKITSAHCLARVSVVDTTGQVSILKGHTDFVNSASYSRTGKWVATSSDDNTVDIWTAPGGGLLRTLSGHDDDVYWTAFGPNDSLIATASADHTIKIWRGIDGTLLRTLQGHTDIVSYVEFNSDGSRLASACGDGTAIVWNTTTWEIEKVLTGHTNSLECVSFSPDGRKLLTCGRDQTVRVWDLSTWSTIHVIPHPNIVESARFSPDGQHIVTACRDKRCRTFNATTWEPELTLSGHTDWIWKAGYSHDGKYISTASRDGLIIIWNAASGVRVTTLTGHTGDVGSAEFSPDDEYIVSGANDRTGRIWQLHPSAVQTDMSDSTWQIENLGGVVDNSSGRNALNVIHVKDGELRIEFSTEGDGPVEMALYDLRGERIATILRQELEAGTHRAVLPDHAIVPGMYFVRMSTGAYVQSAPLVVN